MPKLLLPLAAVGLGAAGTTAAVQSREKKKAQERVEQFQSSEKKDWDRFTDNTARKSFVKQLGADPMTDPKLLQYADSMNRLKTGKRIADIPGDGGKSYQITKLRGSERLGCTCNDWRYKKSVAQPGEAQDCKHIQQFKEMSKTGSVLPSFLDMDKHEGFIDPRSDDFNKNRAFGLGLGAALPGAAFGALYSGAVKDRSLPKSVALTAAGGLATGVPVGLLALKDFRELQAEGKNPVTGKAHDIAKIKKSQEWARKRYHQMNKTAAYKEKVLTKAAGFREDLTGKSVETAKQQYAADQARHTAAVGRQNERLRKIKEHLGADGARSTPLVVGAHWGDAGSRRTKRLARERMAFEDKTLFPALHRHEKHFYDSDINIGALFSDFQNFYKHQVPEDAWQEVAPAKAMQDHIQMRGLQSSLRDVSHIRAAKQRAEAALGDLRRLEPSQEGIRAAERAQRRARLVAGTGVGAVALATVGLLAARRYAQSKQQASKSGHVEDRVAQRSKTAAARFQDNLPNPVIDGKPHDGTWTIVGSGRLSIPKKTSDIDYMVPLEEIGDLSSFNEYKDVPGAYWKDLDPVKGRPATVVAVPRYAYDKIDASYQQAVDRFGKRKLRHLKKTLPKDSFYKDIGVVYTSDAMKKESAYEEGGSFTHDGQEYSLREAFRTARTKPTEQMAVDKLKWVLQYGQSDPLRVASADLKAPVIVAPDRKGRPTVVDGHHRLSKAVQQGKKTLPAKVLTLGELKKLAGHVEDRIAERAPGAEPEVNTLRAKLRNMKLRKGQTYHIPLKRGRGYAVVGDVGDRHVVKTVLGPSMRPPGERLKVAEAKDNMASIKSKLKEGDILLMTPKQSRKQPAFLSAPSAMFTRISTALQGSHAHSAIYVGKNQVVEARIEDGVQKRNLEEALDGIKSAIVVRPKASKKVREGAANFAESRVGRDYDSLAFLAGQGASLLIPEKMAKNLISRKQNPEDADKFICGNLISASYAANGFSPNGEEQWDLTVPRDFLNPDTNKKVGVIGDPKSHNATLGRFAEQTKISAYGDRKRDYKKEYAEYHAKPEQVENRSLRNQARRKLGLKKGDPREADHKTPLSKGGGNGHSNLRAVSRKTNRTKFTDPA
jgi:hypothetical protein